MTWWKEAFGYQIYIRSFSDSNNDGIGDIKGITNKLDYLHDLGINLIWICPFYDSPMDDFGYDVRNFYEISKDYGTLDDLKEMINKAHKLGIKVIIDLILNHTSDEHPWFLESKKSKDNPYRNYYIWEDPKIVDGKNFPPTNWASFFGGSAWEYDEVTNQYYMKIFSNKMPDLNWKNPLVMDEFIKIIEFWHRLGIDGFRIDAVSHLEKSEFTDSSLMLNDEGFAEDWGRFSNLENLHKYLKELRQKAFKKFGLLTIGEVGGGASVDDALKYVEAKNEELDMVFNFDHNWCNHAFEANDASEIKTDVLALKQVFNKWQTGLYGKSWNALYWLNHDHPRLLSHYGNLQTYPVRSAKLLATALYFMWGTAFIYNGEEIGMTNPLFREVEDVKDKSVVDHYNRLVSSGKDKVKVLKKLSLTARDNARSLMQWDSGINGGFSKATPWRATGNYLEVNVEEQLNDKFSILNYYKKIIKLKMHSIYKTTIVYGDYKQVFYDNIQVYAYIRRYKDISLLVICNFSEQNVVLDDFNYRIKNQVLSNVKKSINVKDFKLELAPYEATVLEIV